MKTIRLGKTGMECSRIGFGGIPIQRLTEAGAVRVVQRCLDLGVTFIDTAHGYTTSEERIGKAIAGRRDQVILATKTPGRDRDTALEHLKLSLKRLGTDTIDLWQFHGVSTFEAYEQVLGPGGAMEAAQEALRAGTVHHIGITSHSMDVALEAVPSGLFETIQFPFNFVTSEPAERLLPLAETHDVGFIAMKPLAGGMLDDANLAIKYLLQFDGVLPDPGIETTGEIEEIIAIVDGSWALTPQERQEMARIREELGTRFCRRCDYCQPCPEGIPISTIMNMRSFWKRMSAAQLTSGWVAAGVEKARNCAECGTCEERCPYELPIREMIVENVTFFEEMIALER
jgi:predicted aldo/keto reductase-like oxidoreductase